MGFAALEDVEGKIKNLQGAMGKVFDEAGPDMDLSKVKSVKGTTHDIAAQVRQWNDELTDLSKQHDDLIAVKRAAERAKSSWDDRGNGEDGSPDGNGDNGSGPLPQQRKSLGEMFIKSAAFTEKKGSIGPVATLDVDLKTLMTTAAGWAPEVTRTGQMVPFATRPIQVVDVIPQTTTTQTAVQYMEETTFTNNASETDEGGTYPESALAYTEKQSNVRKISTFLPVTDEQLEDVPQVRGMIDNRLPFMIRQRLDLQIISGSGTGTPTQLRGILNVVGIQTQAKGADPTPDAIYKGIVKVEVTGQAFANLVIMHPTNWQDVRLLRTADGLYIWGNPSDTGPERIWGLQVVRAQAATLGTSIVGDFANFSELAVRRGLDTQISNSHSTYFVEGKQAVRADIRVAFVVYRPAAFCTVTGL